LASCKAQGKYAETQCPESIAIALVTLGTPEQFDDDFRICHPHGQI
jgi:hypothetical protein